MAKEKNDGANKDVVVPPVQQNRSAVRTLPAWLSYCHPPLYPCALISNSLYCAITRLSWSREHAWPHMLYFVWCVWWVLLKPYLMMKQLAEFGKYARSFVHWQRSINVPCLYIKPGAGAQRQVAQLILPVGGFPQCSPIKNLTLLNLFTTRYCIKNLASLQVSSRCFQWWRLGRGWISVVECSSASARNCLFGSVGAPGRQMKQFTPAFSVWDEVIIFCSWLHT